MIAYARTVQLPTVEVPGGRVEYADIPGRPDLPPLLFLHEGLGSVGLWRGFHEDVAAATGRRTVAYSRLGHGWSDLPPAKRTTTFMHEEARTVVPALREALGLERPALIGHSDGASIALLHAAIADVSALVVIAPHVFVEEVGLAGIAQARAEFEEGDLRRRMARHHRDPDVTFANWCDVWRDPAFRDWDLRPDIAAITCPILAVQGTEDRYGTVAHVEAIRDTVRSTDVELLILGGGHAPHLEHRERVRDAIVARLDGR
ncbi:Pimeloyl-ACP methyl ester carboxylesterase [Pseudonocardia thermophila]|uniref:Pimeloyl-ACP methyl ester carboxylesterase n=1 Tax=Pseudonocardia thermophila TaxID=1848 RepID=A0A1M6Z1U7_PSETH|nr:Pimeloyl-ACP methyl ester carboxylesterase [Pseudonocardia thermophila]